MTGAAGVISGLGITVIISEVDEYSLASRVVFGAMTFSVSNALLCELSPILMHPIANVASIVYSIDFFIFIIILLPF